MDDTSCSPKIDNLFALDPYLKDFKKDIIDRFVTFSIKLFSVQKI